MKKLLLFLFILSAILLPASAEMESISPGALIKGSQSSVYYYANDGGRYAFPNLSTFSTWFNDFSSIRIISDLELAQIPFKGTVNCRPGIKMLKIQTDPKVYAVDSDGKLRWIKTEETAKAIYGEDWNKKIIDMPVVFFTNYQINANTLENPSVYDQPSIVHQTQTINITTNVKSINATSSGTTSSGTASSGTASSGTAPSGTASSEPTPSGTASNNPPSSLYKTYYVQPNGGTASQCTGLSNSPYPGSGTSQNCAFKHPFVALPPDGSPLINGGDTMIIASGSYKMGYGAPVGTGNCDIHWTYGCQTPRLPSGPDAAHPTRILGEGWDILNSQKPELYGVERAEHIFDLSGANNIEIQNLEITDHSACVEFHGGDNPTALTCVRDTYPHGEWASAGITANDSSNVLLKNLDIHGLASAGIRAARITDWRVENTNLSYNGWVGWEGDINGDDHNHGTIALKKVHVDWNGCGQTYPGKEPTGCWGQSTGGYGDGLGTGTTGGDWLIEDSTFNHNTSDGLDLLYHRDGGTITIRRTHAEGNAGNQIKTAGNTTITDSVVIANCAFFEGKPFTHGLTACRAGGSPFAFEFGQNGDTVNLLNNSVYSETDCIMGAEDASRPSKIFSRNNIYVGGIDYYQPWERSCLVWRDNESQISFDNDHSIIYGVKDYGPACPIGANDICSDPLLVSLLPDNYDLRLKTGSPAIDYGTSSGITSIDNLSLSRPYGEGVDIGAYEIRF